MIGRVKISLSRYSKSKFLKNSAKLITGTALSQLILIGTTPIIYRIYDKEEFGITALYMSIATIAGSFSTLQYTQAILLEKEDDDALQVLWLIRFFNVCLTIAVFFLVVFGGSQIASVLNSPNLRHWLILLPISVFFSGQNEIFRIWANRKQQYGVMLQNTVLTSILVSAVSIFVGLWHKGPLGLFLGVLMSQAIPALYLGRSFSKAQTFGWHTINIIKIKRLARKYIDFPRYTLPSVFINQLNNQLPIFILSSFFGPVVVGTYSLSIRMLGIPSQLLSTSIGEVFRQRATEDFNRSGSFQAIFIKTLKILTGLSITPFFIVLLFSPNIFTLAFGNKWVDAGIYSQSMSIMFLLRFIVSPLTYAYCIMNRQKEDFCLHLLFLVSTFASLYLGVYFFDSVAHMLLLYAVFYSLIYFIYLVRSHRLSMSRLSS